MIRETSIVVACVIALTNGLLAQEPPKREFTAITLELDEICRAWFIPTDNALAEKKWKSKQIPGYSEELGLIKLTGRMRYKDAITFDELLQSTKLNGLDLSYIDVREDELVHISKCRTLRQLFLSGVRLPDHMIDTLGRMRQLEYLNVFDSNLTKEQLQALTARLPNTKIEAMRPDRLAATCDGYLHLELSK